MGRRLLSVIVVFAVAGAACTGAAQQSSTAPKTPHTASRPWPASSQPRSATHAGGVDLDLGALADRAAHTATTLANGGLLVAGGCVVDGCGSATDETFLVAPDGASATSGPAMSSPRASHTASLLSDGRVVLIGGFAGEGQPSLSSIDVFDPLVGSMVGAANMALGRGGHAAAVLGDGRVLITGGWIGPRTYTASTELFDPATGTLVAGPDAPVGADALDAVVLADGRVLVTGGQIQSGVGTTASAIFDPGTDAWVETGPMLTPRFKHSSVLLTDGSVLVMGGTTDDRSLLATTEIFDPDTKRFTQGPDLAEPRYKMQGGAVVLDDHRVVIAGGGRTIELLDLDTETSTIIDEFTVGGSFATINRLGSGDLLVIGGYDDRIDLRRKARLLKAIDTSS